MDIKISATELARHLGDILGRIRYRGETFTIEKNGAPIARLTPAPTRKRASVAEAFAAWKSVVGDDPTFADDLERVNLADQPEPNPWDS